MKYWYDRLVASDPDLNKFRTGLRGLLTAALGTILLLGLARGLHVDHTPALIGAIVPLMSTLAVQDASIAQQRVTMLCLPLVTATVIASASVLVPNPWASGIGFLAVIFAAFEARRFGPRGAALGTMAYQAFFYALLIQVKARQIGWVALFIVLGTAVAWTVRFGILPEQPQAQLRQELRACRALIAALLADLAARLDAAAGERAGRRIERALVALHDLCLGIDMRLARFAREGDAGLRDRLLRAEIAAETLASAVDQAATQPADQTRSLRDLLLRLRRMVRSGKAASQPPPGAAEGDPLPLGPELRWRFRRAVQVLVQEPPWAATLPRLARTRAPGAPPVSAEPDLRAHHAGVHPEEPTRRAVQATVSALGAIVIGHVISSEHWYWAVFASFIVFTQSISVGQTLAGAWKRILANVLGVVLGLALAHLVLGSRGVSLVLLFLLVGPAFYAFRSWPAFYAMLLTAMLALFYGVLGEPVPRLLEIRLAETLAGAAVSVLVASVVFPVYAREHSDLESAALLRESAELLDAAFQPPPQRPPRDAVRDLDRRLQRLRQAVGPVTASSVPARKAAHRYRLRRLSMLVYCLRHLYHASALHPEQIGAGDAALLALARSVRANALLVADALEGHQRKPMQDLPRGSPDAPAPDDPDQGGRAAAAEHWLREIDAVVRTMEPMAASH